MHKPCDNVCMFLGRHFKKYSRHSPREQQGAWSEAPTRGRASRARFPRGCLCQAVCSVLPAGVRDRFESWPCLARTSAWSHHCGTSVHEHFDTCIYFSSARSIFRQTRQGEGRVTENKEWGRGGGAQTTQTRLSMHRYRSNSN